MQHYPHPVASPPPLNICTPSPLQDLVLLKISELLLQLDLDHCFFFGAEVKDEALRDSKHHPSHSTGLGEKDEVSRSVFLRLPRVILR